MRDLQIAIVAVSMSVIAVASIAAANAIEMEKLRSGFGPIARATSSSSGATAAVDLQASE